MSLLCVFSVCSLDSVSPFGFPSGESGSFMSTSSSTKIINGKRIVTKKLVTFVIIMVTIFTIASTMLEDNVIVLFIYVCVMHKTPQKVGAKF